MAENFRSAHSYSLVNMTKRFIMIALPVLLISVAISAVSVINIKQQNLASIENSVSIYQESIQTKLRAVQHYILWSIANEPLLENIEAADNPYEKGYATFALQARVNDSQLLTGTEYHYFFYDSREEFFINASNLNIPYENYLKIKNSMIEHITSGQTIKNNFTWQTEVFDNAVYLYYIITYLDRTFGVYIDVSDLAQPLSCINLGKNGALIITDLDGNPLFSNPPSERQMDHSLFYHLATFNGKDHSLPFNILIYSDSFSNYGGLLFWQLFVSIAALGWAFILGVYIYYMYFKVIKPIQDFSKNLAAINQQEDFINLQSSRIRELEQASIQFKNLINEIEKLKIRIYEQELDKRKFQITFLQRQIRPHFYLNCLTTIDSMAQLGKTKDIRSMALITSRYLYYLFHTDKEKVRIKYELQHIQAYLEIQEMRYGPTFTYQITIQPEDEDALIPPLLLITFIENAIKHSQTVSGQLHIGLDVVRQMSDSQTFLKIDIADSGQGFSNEMLVSLSNGDYMDKDDSSHVGILNSIKRLKLIYGTDHKIDFFNEERGGAHIRMLIPYQTQENENERTDRR